VKTKWYEWALAAIGWPILMVLTVATLFS